MRLPLDLLAAARMSVHIMKIKADSGQPCLTPWNILKWPVRYPLTLAKAEDL